MILPDITEYIAGYFNFIIDFAINPKKTCEPYKATNSVDKTLLTYAAIGTFFTWLIILLTKRIAEVYNDKSSILQGVDKIDADKIPLIMLPCIIIISLLVHVTIKVVFLLNKKEYSTLPRNAINFKNTVNGALAFFSFAPFVLMLSFLITMLFLYNINPAHLKFVIFIVIMLPVIFLATTFILWYFPISLSAVQPDELSKGYRKSVYTVYGFILFLFAIQDWIKDALK
jgi:cytochrome bd-type quinol oxidase subunit 2